MPITVTIQNFDGKKFAVNCQSENSTVGELKQAISNYTGMPTQNMHLYSGPHAKIIDSNTLRSYNIMHSSTVNLVPKKGMQGGSSEGIKRLRQDLQDISADPPSLCTAGPAGDDLFEWAACLVGPVGTPYESGLFKVRLTFPSNFPMRPPAVRFETPIFHPNVYSSGNVCMDILSSEWSPVFTVRTVLLSISALLACANPKSPANGEAALLYANDQSAFNSRASEWTRTHAVNQ